MLTKEELVDFSNRRSSQTHFASYDDYVNSQIVYGLSHESENQHWKKGQIRCINDKLAGFNRDISILDVCCGDGVGLLHLKELGFKNVVGVELSDKKIERAQTLSGFEILKKDICSGPFDFGQEFDVIYSSHTIEHVLHPEYTLTQLKKSLKKDGVMFLVLPYPDVAASSPHNVHQYKVHCGVIPLGLHVKDNGLTTCSIMEKLGLAVVKCEFFDYREPEIHLSLKNI